jgi:hypothetical protein
MSLIYTNYSSKVKPKQKSKRERDEYAAWCAKYGIDPTGKTRSKKLKTSSAPTIYAKSPVRESATVPSLNLHVKGAVTCGERKVYTGDKIVGIAAMHKSNLVPIFNDDAAKDVASMRR